MCVACCASKNGYQKDMSLKEIGSCAQNMIGILNSTVNIVEGFIGSFDEHENLHFDNK